MGLIYYLKKSVYLYVLSFAIVHFNPQTAFSAKTGDLPIIREKQSSDKILILKVQNDTSLDNLISKSGYYLEDENINIFLTDFMNLNAPVKSISILKKGAVIRLPLKRLKKAQRDTGKIYSAPDAQRIRKKIIRKNKIEKTAVDVPSADKSLILANVKTLFQSLDDNATVDAEGLKIFQISDKSELILDKSFFPSINLRNEHILVFDYTGILPEELKNLLEISWPEYRFVSYTQGMKLKDLVYVLLKETGYTVTNSHKLVIGGRSQVVYYPDFLVFSKDNDFMHSEISLVSIIDYNENKSPDYLVNWLNTRGIRVVELSNHELKQSNNITSRTTYIEDNKTYNKFTESILTLLGYTFSRDKTINISNRKEFTYNIKTDISITLGYKTKAIEFKDLSEDVVEYAKKHGLDISFISPLEDRIEMTEKIMALLSLEFSSIPQTTSTYITPPSARYKLFLPGVYAKSRKGMFFFTDSELENNLLESLVDEKITIVKF